MKLQNIVNLNYTVTLVMRVLTRFTADTSLPTPARYEERERRGGERGEGREGRKGREGKGGRGGKEEKEGGEGGE